MEDRNKANSQRKYKFIRRSLTCKSYNMSQAIFAQTRVKRFYFKELDEMGFDSDRPYYSKGKQISCLTKIKTELKCKSHYLNLARKAINLRSVEIEVPFTNPLRNALSFVKRLSKNIEVFIISGTQNMTTVPQIKSLYSSLTSFPKLKLVKRYLAYSGEKGRFIEQECQKINQCLSRKKQQINFYYQQSQTCQPGFQRIMIKDQSCPYINELSMVVVGSNFESFRVFNMELRSEHMSEDYEMQSQITEEWEEEYGEEYDIEEQDNVEEEGVEEEEDMEENNERDDFRDDYGDEDDRGSEIGEDFDAPAGGLEEDELEEIPRLTKADEQTIKKDIIPFFKFHLFPNLRRLDLNILKDCFLYPLDSFVIEGFKSLKNLEELRLAIECRPVGTKFLLEGLLELPLLTGFTLDIPLIKEDEGDLLTQFIQKQTKLVSLSIKVDGLGFDKMLYAGSRKIKRVYKIQNLCLEDLCQHIGKFNLKYINLHSKIWTLESLSKGLKKITKANQFQELTLGVFDDHVTSSLSPYERVEGVCDFLKSQKLSLKSLTISLGFVCDDIIIDSLVKTISELEELDELSLQINDGHFVSITECKTFLGKGYSHKFPKGVKEAIPSFSQTFQELEKTLRKLKKLSRLDIFFSFMEYTKKKPDINSLRIIDALAGIDTLRKACFCLPCLKECVKKYPNHVQKLLQIKNILSLNITTAMTFESVKKIEDILEEINAKNSARSDLMFY